MIEPALVEGAECYLAVAPHTRALETFTPDVLGLDVRERGVRRKRLGPRFDSRGKKLERPGDTGPTRGRPRLLYLRKEVFGERNHAEPTAQAQAAGTRERLWLRLQVVGTSQQSVE